METKEVRVEDLKEYRPTELGPKVLIPVAVVLGIWLPVVAKLCTFFWNDEKWPHLGPIFAVVFFLGFGGSLSWAVMFSKVCKVAYRDYWRRNVIGYEAAFWLTGEGRLGRDVLPRFSPHGGLARLLPEGSLYVVLALGGWGSRSRINGNDFAGWRVKPDWSCSDVRARFTDCYGDAVNIPVKEFLRRKGDSAFVDAFRIGWRLIFQAAVNKIDQLRREGKWSIERLERCQKEIGELRGQRDTLTMAVLDWAEKYAALLIGMIEQLDATKRFIKSKEAKEIRNGLVTELLGMLPDEDPRRKKYAAERAKNARDKAASPAKPAASTLG